MAGESFLSRQALDAAQLVALRELLGALLSGNEFYRPRLIRSGLDSPLENLAAYSTACPFTCKGELVEDQRRHPPFGTNLTFPMTRYTRFHQTSGSTGVPLRWLDDSSSWAGMMQNWRAIFGAAGVTEQDRVFFAFSFGPFIGFWLAFEAAAALGCLCLPGGGMSSAARLRVIFDNRASVLCCTPTYAIRLAEVAAQEKMDLVTSPVRLIILAGEPGGSIPSVRQRVETLWSGARVFDHHGMTETGPVTYECPARPGRLHVIEMAYFAEIVDPSGQAVAPGEEGELILTTLRRTGSPVLRYRTGDLVREVGVEPGTEQAGDPPPCICGRHERALEGGILGRVDDMVVVRGVNVFPSAVEEIVRGLEEAGEYRVYVNRSKSLAELRVEVEPKADCTNPSDLPNRLADALQRAFSLRVPVSLVPVGTFPSFEMKAKRWIHSQ